MGVMMRNQMRTIFASTSILGMHYFVINMIYNSKYHLLWHIALNTNHLTQLHRISLHGHLTLQSIQRKDDMLGTMKARVYLRLDECLIQDTRQKISIELFGRK